MSQPARDAEPVLGGDALPPTEAPPRPSAAPGPVRQGAPSPRARSAPELSRAVLEGLTRREPGALAAFWDAYFERIYGYVRRLVHDEHLTEDLTQNIFVHIHRAFGSYDATRALSPWVFTIATNKLRDFWQSRRFQDGRRQVSLGDEDSGPLLPRARGRGPRDELEGREQGERVSAAIARLPESLRVPFWLRWHEELAFADIARQLDISEVAARKRFSRALADLRRLLGRDGDADDSGGAP